MTHSLRLGKLNKSVMLAASALFVVVGWFAFSADHASAKPRSGGGLAITSKPAAKKKVATRFGHRTLREGMAGDDVRILKSIVRSKSLLLGTPLTTDFDSPTTSAVKTFQRDRSIRPNGVVNKSTSKTLIRSMRTTEASWYGPGLYGNGVACGGTLRPGTIGVAHKTLPCGSKVLVGYRGKFLMTKVIDRGPYIAGRSLDLTYAGADALGFISAGVANVRYAVVNRK